MTRSGTPDPVRQMIREAVEALGSPTGNAAVPDTIREPQPGCPTTAGE